MPAPPDNTAPRGRNADEAEEAEDTIEEAIEEVIEEVRMGESGGNKGS